MRRKEKTNKLTWIQELAKDKEFCAVNVLSADSSWPTPIAKSYADLLCLMENGSVYGALLQIKDLYEIILKMPVLAALIYICGTSKEVILNDSDFLEKWISKPLSLGNWDTLAATIIKRSKSGQYSLPGYLVDGIRKTRNLVSKRISTQYPNIIYWRNDVIGHGALQFEESEEYQIALRGMLTNLKYYFEGRGKCFQGCEQLYERIVFVSGGVALRGKDIAIKDSNAGLNLSINGTIIDAGEFIQLDSFLFSSFYYNKRTIKYLDYESGKDLIKDDFLFCEYVSAYQDSWSYRDYKVATKILRREEEEMFSLLSRPRKYIPPESVFQKIEQYINENSKGIIMLCMERGMGKSAFANSIDNLYNDPSTAIIEDTVIRSYSLGNAALRGVSDFINAINVIFTRSYNTGNDIRFSEQIKPEVGIDSERPAQAMATILNLYRELYARELGIYNLMLVLDGVDEVTIDTGEILEFLPNADLLNEGVYIVLTSRFEDEEDVRDYSKKQISKMLNKSDLCIEVRRNGDDNRQLLERYIYQEYPYIGKEDVRMLIQQSDYRMLYLKVRLPLYKQGMQFENDDNIVSDYISYLLRKYNGHSGNLLRKVVAIIGLFGPISIKDYFDYISREELTYGFIGAVNDLLPLMTVRGSDYGREYMLSNEAYGMAVATGFSEEIILLVDNLKEEFSNTFFANEDEPNTIVHCSAHSVGDEKIIDYSEYFRAGEKEALRECVFWILTIKKVLSFAVKYGYEGYLLTEDFVNKFLLFSDEFITNHQHFNSRFIDGIGWEIRSVAISMLLVLAEKNGQSVHFSDVFSFGSFSRKIYHTEGYDDLLKTVFYKNASRALLEAWQVIFFSCDFIDSWRPARTYIEDTKLIEQIERENLLETIVDLLSPEHGKCYLSYLLLIQTLKLDDSLMEKVMNRIVWSYLAVPYECNEDEARVWLKQIEGRGYNVQLPDNEEVKERIVSCLNYKETSTDETITSLFSGFCLINNDLLGVDFQDINRVLNSTDPGIKGVAFRALKKCFDYVNNIFEEGIFPNDLWSEEERNKRISEMENGDADDSFYERLAEQDRYTILDNCCSLLQYVNLVYVDNTAAVLEKWINHLDSCLEKHSDWESYNKLHNIVDVLYVTIDHCYENDNEKRIAYLSRYVKKYSTRSLFSNAWISCDLTLDDLLLPCDASLVLISLYHNAGLDSETESLCVKISDDTVAFNNMIPEMIQDKYQFMYAPLMAAYYSHLYHFICTCKELGFHNTISTIHIDFRGELSELRKRVATCNKFSDLTDIHEIVEYVLNVYKEVGGAEVVSEKTLIEMVRVLDDRISAVDEETVSELGTIIERIREVHGKIYNEKTKSESFFNWM